jgi:hypothetical protein
MAKANNNKPKKKGVSDKELIAKYETGEKLNFDTLIEVSYKKPRNFSLTKKNVKK